MLICASFPGWTVEYVESTLDGPRLQQITNSLVENPPLHVLVMAAIGYEPQTALKPQTEEEKLSSFMDAFCLAGGNIA